MTLVDASIRARIPCALCRGIRRAHYLLAGGILAAGAAVPVDAFACGASGGAAGVSACSLEEHLEEMRPKWRVGAGYSYTSTAIRFASDTRLGETRHTVLATLDYAPTPAWTFELGAGSLLGGSLHAPAADHDFTPGFLTVAGAAWRVVDAEGARPLVVLTAELSFVASSTRENGSSSSPSIGYQAFDARIGAIAGWTVARVLTPYVLARGFGGPVYWQYLGKSVTGTDTHHYQLGGGVIAHLGSRIDVFAEGVPLGEQAVSAGAGVRF